MDVSVIIINWNGLHYLKDCLKSIFSYTDGIDFEIILVDNGSRDGSVNWVKENYPKVQIVANSRNLGFSKANNQAMEVSEGKYILLLNNDTVFTQNAIEKMHEFLEKEKQRIGILGPKLIYPEGREQISVGRFPSIGRLFLDRVLFVSKIWSLIPNSVPRSVLYGMNRGRLQRKNVVVDWVSGACLMMRNELVTEIGGLDENYPFGIEDIDIAFQARKRGWKVYYLKDACVIHYKGMSRGGNEKCFIKRTLLDTSHIKWNRISSIEGILYFFRKNKAPWEFLVAKFVIKIGALLRLIYYLLRKALTKDSSVTVIGAIEAYKDALFE